MSARTVIASTTHGKEYRLDEEIVFGPAQKRYTLNAGQAKKLDEKLKRNAPIIVEEISAKVAKVERDAAKRGKALELRIEELEAQLAAKSAELRDLERKSTARVEELEALLEEATATPPRP